MPFQSEKQRRFLWKNHPEIAKKWAHNYGSQIQKAAKSRLKKSQHPVGKKNA